MTPAVDHSAPPATCKQRAKRDYPLSSQPTDGRDQIRLGAGHQRRGTGVHCADLARYLLIENVELVEVDHKTHWFGRKCDPRDTPPPSRRPNVNREHRRAGNEAPGGRPVILVR